MSTLVKQVLWMWIIKRQLAEDDMRFQAAVTNFNPILQYPQLPDYDQSKTMDVYRAQLTMQVTEACLRLLKFASLVSPVSSA